MPEGDTVHRQCRVLDEALAGGELTTAELRVPRLATRDLVGWTVDGVAPRGKHLLIRLDPSDAREALTLHNHLMMEGRWQVDIWENGAPEPRWRSPAHQARIVLQVRRPDGRCARAIGYDVQQVRLVRRSEEDMLVGHLGPDLLDPDWDGGMRDEAVARLREQPDRALGVALLDQRNLAGIGNVYRSELCFLTRVHPAITIAAFDADHDLPALVDLAQRLLHVNRDRTTRITTGGMMGRRGDLWVYGRSGQRCRRCASTVRRQYIENPSAPEQEDRSIYVCPRCQSEGAPETGADRSSGRAGGARGGTRGRGRGGR